MKTHNLKINQDQFDQLLAGNNAIKVKSGVYSVSDIVKIKGTVCTGLNGSIDTELERVITSHCDFETVGDLIKRVESGYTMINLGIIKLKNGE